MQDHLTELNDNQRQAASHRDGPLLVVAGAGAGKTKTITHRIVNLVKGGVAPNNILAVTFTNKAAKEMRERVINEIEKSAPGQDSVPFVSTFHSLGVYIIKENARLLGLTKYFTILDERDSTTLIKEILKSLDLDPRQHDPKRIKNIISRAKGEYTQLPEYLERAGGVETSEIVRIVAQLWPEYERRKAKENSLDFDDLLLRSTKLLKDNEEIRKIYQDRWQYIHIDEYQDTNRVQYLMSQLLSGEDKNICVVGDYDQCMIKGTKIKMADGTLKPIEKIKKGELVLSNYGGGKLHPARVSRKRSLQAKGDLIRIKTTGGRTITSTPNHIHFAGYRLGSTPQTYINYLMYKKNMGWRIGTTSVHTKGQKRPTVGFVQRSNQEHADATWVIGTHKTPNQARIQEYIFSLKYQLPTIPFTPRRGQAVGGYVHNQTALKKIFSSLDTEGSALRLLSDLGQSREYPHHKPQNRNSTRRNINVTLCADSRGKTPMHLISTFGNDLEGKRKLKSLGLSVRPAKKNNKKNWRFETVSSDYGKACLLATKIASLFPDSSIVFRARLGGMKDNPRDGNSLPCLPAGSIMPGMSLFSIDGYDTVSKVSKISIGKTKVFDLDVEKTHNFVANDIVTHNCIYSWRGANLKNILSFERDYPGAKIVILEENYRSTKNILEAANSVIKKNKNRPEKNLFTQNTSGEKIDLYEALDEVDEADFVATKILEIKDRAGLAFENGLAGEGTQRTEPAWRTDRDLIKSKASSVLSSVAILYRANFQSRALEEAMLRYNIPYQVLGVKFFERKEVKDTLAYLRAALNKDSLSDIKRIINFPKRGIGKVTLAKIFSGTGASLPEKTKIKINSFYQTLSEIEKEIKKSKASDVIKFVVKISGIEKELSTGTEEELERLENIRELATLAVKYDTLPDGAGIEKLLEDASLASDQDSLMGGDAQRKVENSVKLMTIHAAKGLEFKHVFITGLEDGLFPHKRHEGEAGSASARVYGEAMEEERRLFYVAITRAKEKLHMSFADFRTIFGSRQVNTPSEFIGDIPTDLLEKEGGKNLIKTVYL
jgi:DNA helicase II / ATP-dependent DNA helicase PcrA